ncbi:Yip1 family protein [Sphingomonas caeni]|uniref:Yip1 family protein n=1 Tax=Sphingomonas caeni TaxID=2984949 RepID=UPI0022302831|nr:Yip1 family protein [Sphingomonas caeni]
MIGRIKAILMDPKNEFQRIDAEPMTVSGIMTGWVVPLAAIGPVAGLIGMSLFFSGFGGLIIRPSMTWLIGSAVISYVLALVSAYVVSLIIDALAPSFGGQKNPVQALKAFAYAMTAAYIGGIFAIIPMLGILGLVAGVYSLYLLYIGLPILMKSPPDKAVGYVVVTIVVAILVMWTINLVTGAIMVAFMGSPITGLRM